MGSGDSEADAAKNDDDKSNNVHQLTAKDDACVPRVVTTVMLMFSKECARRPP